MHADFLAMAAAGGFEARQELGEVETFILENRLDDIAARNLRAEAPQVQRLVMDRGSLAECLNPSSAVIGRIRDAKLQVKYGSSGARDRDRGGDRDRDHDRSGGGGGSRQPSSGEAAGTRNASPDEVEVFIRINRLDDTAARNLRAEPARVQAVVMDRGTLEECINPSSAVMGRIRDAKLQIKYGSAPAARGAASGHREASATSSAAELGGDGMTADTVEQFIEENRLDDMAARNLRAEPAQVQAAVLARGSLAECLNPSSALIGRIRDAKLQVKYGTSAPAHGGMAALAGAQGLDGAAAAAAAAQLQAASLGMAGFGGLGLDGLGGLAGGIPGLAGYGLPGGIPGLPGYGLGLGLGGAGLGVGGAGLGAAGFGGLGAAGFGTAAGAGFGAAAGAGFGAAGLGYAGLGMGGGLAAAAAGVPGVGGAVADGPQDVESFIVENGLDDGAARALRAEIPDVQDEVMSRGSLLACTNPSSAVMGRIREARQQRNSLGTSYSALGTAKTGPRAGPY